MDGHLPAPKPVLNHTISSSQILNYREISRNLYCISITIGILKSGVKFMQSFVVLIRDAYLARNLGGGIFPLAMRRNHGQLQLHTSPQRPRVFINYTLLHLLFLWSRPQISTLHFTLWIMAIRRVLSRLRLPRRHEGGIVKKYPRALTDAKYPKPKIDQLKRFGIKYAKHFVEDKAPVEKYGEKCTFQPPWPLSPSLFARLQLINLFNRTHVVRLDTPVSFSIHGHIPV